MTNIVSDICMHGGRQYTLQHYSDAVNGMMTLSFYLPSNAANQKVPALLYLSGLTCTWENAATKAGLQYWAEHYNVAIIFPDTSPRGDDVANDDSYDLGQGAGFYLKATQEPWAQHYNMQDYILHDIIKLMNDEHIPIITDNFAITGHSMGGHGALTLAIKNPNLFTSLSAFAPIVNPKDVPWGQKIFHHYLGDDVNNWANYDACALIQAYGYNNDILIDQGLADAFYGKQLQPAMFAEAASKQKVTVNLREQQGYDHSYYFVASFVKDHMTWHFDR